MFWLWLTFLQRPVWLQYVSHKLGRLLVPYGLLVLFASSLVLVGAGSLYAVAAGAQVIFYLLAAWGAVLDRSARVRAADSRRIAPAGFTTDRAAPAGGRKVINA